MPANGNGFKKTITVHIRRGTRENNRLEAYQVPFESGRSVLGVLEYIYNNIDSTLRYADSCRIGLCTSCLMRVNGKVVRACTTIAEGDLTLEPYKEEAMVCDLLAELPPISTKNESRPIELQ